MARGKKEEAALSLDERLEAALVPAEEQPYKVPENWRWIRWGSCGELIAGSGFKNEYQGFTDHSIPFYKVGSLKYSDCSGYLYDSSNTINEEICSKLNATLIPPNSVIFAKIGEAIRLNRRSLNRVPCCIDNNLMAFLPKSVSYRYAYYWMLGLDLYKYINATTVPAIRKSDLEVIPLPVAPLSEQQHIVERIESLFAKLDEAKEKAQEALDSFEIRKKAMLERAFSGKLTTAWRISKNVAFPWKYDTLIDSCEYLRAGGDKPDDFSVSADSKHIVPVVANGIQNEGIIGYTAIEKEKSGAVTVSGRGTIGYQRSRLRTDDSRPR